jgi:hypothetical protein
MKGGVRACSYVSLAKERILLHFTCCSVQFSLSYVYPNSDGKHVIFHNGLIPFRVSIALHKESSSSDYNCVCVCVYTYIHTHIDIYMYVHRVLRLFKV